MDGVWPYLAAILPTILVAILFYFLVKSMLEGDRRERLAQRRFEAEQDRAEELRVGACGRGFRRAHGAGRRRARPHRTTARESRRRITSFNSALPFGECADNVFPGIEMLPPVNRSKNPEGKTMAKKVQVLLVDDIDKSSPADETVSFSLDGVSYEIDLTSGNAAKLRDDLAVWIGHAERTGGRRVGRPHGIQGLGPQGRPRCGPRLGARQRPPGQRPRPHLRAGPGRLRQGARLSPEHHTDAAPPDPAGAASLMSAAARLAALHHRRPAAALSLRRSPTDAREWQQGLTALQGRWYDVDAPPQVAAVFVLQWLLQVPAHTAAHARGCRPVARRPRRPHLRPRPDAGARPSCASPGFVPDAGPLAERLDRAERDYRAVAEPVAAGVPLASCGSDRTPARRWSTTCGSPLAARPSRRPGCCAPACRRGSRAA